MTPATEQTIERLANSLQIYSTTGMSFDVALHIPGPEEALEIRRFILLGANYDNIETAKRELDEMDRRLPWDIAKDAARGAAWGIAFAAVYFGSLWAIGA